MIGIPACSLIITRRVWLAIRGDHISNHHEVGGFYGIAQNNSLKGHRNPRRCSSTTSWDSVYPYWAWDCVSTSPLIVYAISVLSTFRLHRSRLPFPTNRELWLLDVYPRVWSRHHLAPELAVDLPSFISVFVFACDQYTNHTYIYAFARI